MQNVKEEILMVINQKLNNPSSTNCTFALVGEPGTGKTKIIRILSEILSLPMEQISMGGVNDVSQLEGHSYTYLGSKPGKIVESIQKMKCNNGIIFFDEIDKIGDSRHGREVTNALIHITDFTQNSTFHDNYIGQIPIDLSKIWFIFSLNDENLVNPILRNRMKMIQVPKYSRKDRVEIARKLMNEIYLDLNIDEKVIKFTDENIEYIIDKIKQEAGVRELKRTIETILRKIKLLIDCGDMKTSFDNDKLDLKKRPIKLKESDLDIFMKGMVNVYDFEKMSYFI
jgi:ATP-dependent Lon protease